jgi:hypothetical protein
MARSVRIRRIMVAPTLHDLLVDLFRLAPELSLDAIASARGLRLPKYDEVILATESSEPTRQSALRADLVLVLRRNRRNVAAIVVEVQNRIVKGKPVAWLGTIASARRAYGCDTFLVVTTTSATVEVWASRAVSFGHPGLVLRPIVIGPATARRIVDEAEAYRHPLAALLGAIAHAKGEDASAMLPATLAALGALPDAEGELRIAVVDMLMRTLEPRALEQLEVLMLKNYEIQNPVLRKLITDSRAEGRAEGEARGEARGRVETQIESVLAFLEARGLDVPAWVAERLRACSDSEELGRLVRRAAVVASAEELFPAS